MRKNGAKNPNTRKEVHEYKCFRQDWWRQTTLFNTRAPLWNKNHENWSETTYQSGKDNKHNLMK